MTKVMVGEASVYSASELAAKEFRTWTSIRGAVSIARRLQTRWPSW
jgi:transcriptional accessory protein Tex/SPT6